jgi:hypothetical protein
MPVARTTLLALALLCALAAPASAAWHFELGMGDQQPRMFDDPRFGPLGLDHVRVVTPYDVVCHPGVQQGYLDTWLNAALRTGTRPLVAFSFSWRNGQRWKLPSYRTYLRCFKAFRVRYPQVTDFNPWNEANHSAQPTFRHPKKAAGFYNAMRAACPSCQIAAGDLLDWGNLSRWLARYRPYLRGRPRLWSLHNYIDINRRGSWRTSSTRAFLALTRGRLWITEAAGVVHSPRFATYDEGRAARATRRLFRFASHSRRIIRVYGYHWQAACDDDVWDSAWFRSDGSSRPAYRFLVRELARQRGLAPAAAAALDPPLGRQMYDACADELARSTD